MAERAAKVAKKAEGQGEEEFKTPDPPAPKTVPQVVVKPTAPETEEGEEVMDTSDNSKKDPVSESSSILQSMDAGPKDLGHGDKAVPLQLRRCLDRLLTDQDKATIGNALCGA